VGDRLHISLIHKFHISNRNLILITAFSFFIISLALVSLHETPVNGYEISIYQKIPFIVWIAIIFGLINGGFLFFRYYGLEKKLWAIGLFEILLCNAILISLNFLRGSIYLGKGDSLTYLGYSKDIILNGFLPQYNFYPSISLLISSTSVITNLTGIELVQLLPAFFLTVYLLSIFVWSKSLSHKRGFIAAMLFASLPLFFATFIPPIIYEALCVLMIPIFLYSLQKSKSKDIRYISIICVFFVFFTLGHPLVSLALLLYMIIIFVTERFFRLEKKTVTGPLLLFSSVVFFIWIANQAVLVNSITITLNQMISGPSQTALTDFEGFASKLGLLTTVQSILSSTIDDIIFILLSIWAIILIWKNAWRTNSITPYFACFIGGTILLATLIVTTNQSPSRFVNLNFNMIFTIPLVGFLLYQKQKNGKVTLVRLILFLIVVSLIVSISSIYQDPIQMTPNGTITISETSGVNWFINQKNATIGILTVYTEPSRFADMIYGHIYSQNHAESFIKKDPGNHFTSIMSSNKTIENSYLIISSYDRDAYTTLWQNVNRYEEKDFQALPLSNMINKNFDNGGFSCYIRA